MTQAQIKALYRWEVLDVNGEGQNENCFLESEVFLHKRGIRTRVQPTEEGPGYTLWVPLKDIEVARDLYSGAVRECYTLPVETYHIFEKDLSFKNERLYDDKYKDRMKATRIRNFALLAVVLVVLFVLLRWTSGS